MSTSPQAPWKKAEQLEVSDYVRNPRGYSQSNRPMKVKTALGEDVLLLVEFSGREALSELFEYQLLAVASREVAIRMHELLGHEITVEAPLASDGRTTETGDVRYFHGIVGAIECIDRDATFATYQLTLVPSVWPLQQNQGCRIFQDKTVRQILETVLPSRHVRFDLHETYRPRNYTTQYLESDFDFAARLMEENGIYYYFECTAENDVMVIADRSLLGPEIGTNSILDFDPVGGGTRGRWRVRDWKTGLTLRSAKHVMRDHSFQLPANRLEVLHPLASEIVCGERKHEWSAASMRGLEFFEYPGDFAKLFDDVSTNGGDQKDAYNANLFEQQKQTARIRAEEQVVQSFKCGGSSDCVRFRPGCKFKLSGHDYADDEYLLVSVEHSIRMPDFVASDSEVRDYRNQFTCVPQALPYRPKRTTEEPIIHGSQTATVVGPPGEEIHVDKYGRIKVKFHWDGSDIQDGANSCWVRVASPWAGKGWGMVALPRVGQEVVVAFLDGDPDRPLATSSVYNAEQANTLEDVVANKKNMVIKSQTVGGKPSEFHGIVLDDDKGGQVFAMRSQKHMYQKTPNDMGIGSGRTLTLDAGRGMYETTGGFGFLAAAAGMGEGTGEGASDAANGAPVRFAYGATGSGGGDSHDDDIWVQHLSGARAKKYLGVKWANVVGVDAKSVAGLQWTTLLGFKQDYAINPFGFFPLASAGAMSASAAAFGSLGAGKFAYLFGHSGELIRGSKMTAVTGRTATAEYAKLEGIFRKGSEMPVKIGTTNLKALTFMIGVNGALQAIGAGLMPPMRPLSDDPEDSKSKSDGYDWPGVVLQSALAALQTILSGITFGKSMSIVTRFPADQFKKMSQAEIDAYQASRRPAAVDNDADAVIGRPRSMTPPVAVVSAPLSPPTPPLPPTPVAVISAVSSGIAANAVPLMSGPPPLVPVLPSASPASVSPAASNVIFAGLDVGCPELALLNNIGNFAAISGLIAEYAGGSSGGSGRGGSPVANNPQGNPHCDVRGGTYSLINAGTLIHASSTGDPQSAPASVACVATGKNSTFLASASRAVQLLAYDGAIGAATGRSEIYMDNAAGILLSARSKDGVGEIALSSGTRSDDDQQVMILGKSGTFIRCGKKGKGQRIVFTKKGIVIESTEQPISIKSKKGNIEIQTDGGDLSIDTKGGKATIDAGNGELALKGKGGVKLECGSSTVELSAGSIDMNSGAYNLK